MAKKKREALVPMLRFPEFRRNGEWDRLNGDQLFAQINDRNHNGDLPVLAITQDYGAIPRDLIDYNVSVSESSLNSYKIVRIGDFIISLRSFQGGIEFSNYEGLCSPAYVVLREKRDTISSFFKHFFKSKIFIRELTKNLEGLRDGKMISYRQFSDVEINLPCKAEQQKIADCLGSLDDLIAAHNAKLDALQDHKKGLLQQIFLAEGETVPKLRFPGFEGEWETATLSEVMEIASGQVDPRETPFSNLPHIGGENIESHTGNIHSLKSAKELRLISGKYLFDETYVLYSKIRPALNKVALPNFKGICSADIYPLRPSGTRLNKEYLAYLLLSEGFLNYAIKHSARGKIPKVNREALMSYEVALPRPTEQQKIADCLNALDALITSQSDKIAVLKEYKRGLMQKLFPNPN